VESPLTRPVETFIADMEPVVLGLAAGRLSKPEKVKSDIALEAFNLAAAFVDSDGRHTDEELEAFLDVFADRFDTVARAGSATALRTAGLLAGKRTFLDSPSPLFDLLVHADVRNGTVHSWRYYLDALEVAQAVCALDAYPSHAELTALERFRTMLVRTMDQAGVARPGSARAQRGASNGPSTAAQDVEAPDEPLEPPRPLEELLAELDSLVGLVPVKAEVKLVTNLLRVAKLRAERNLPVVEHSHHLVFTGNPGTGKTTVARLLAQIYRTLGVVEQGHLVETDRAGLVAGYVGQTAIKVKQVFNSALEGILLIDEAHALARGQEHDFGHEAIDMIVKLMEDHRDEIVLIVAGYPDEMAVFLDANPGLRSRFPKTIFFDDYSNEELVRIFEEMCRKARYTPTADAKARLLAYVSAQPRGRGFGNARLVRNLFEAAIANQASRVVNLAEVSDEILMTLEAPDIPSLPATPAAS
jgi:Cdc6-like AAA superfamily ATPase